MNPLKSLYFSIALLATGVAQSTRAASIILDYGSYHEGVGGAFVIRPITSGTGTDILDSQNFVNNISMNYAAEATFNSGFETFCIEYTQHFSPGSVYEVALSNSAIGSPPDQVSVGSGYLYSLFATGQLDDLLPGFSYTSTSSMGELQNTLWFLEGEGIANPGTFNSLLTAEFGASTYWTQDGATSVNLGPVTAASYGVSALNVGGAPDYPNQDQLVYQRPANVPVPEGGDTLVLLGMSVGALALLKKRSAR